LKRSVLTAGAVVPMRVGAALELSTGKRPRAVPHGKVVRLPDLVKVGVPLSEDYGWGFWVGATGRAPVWVALSWMGPVAEGSRVEQTSVSVSVEAPVLPWKRLKYEPDYELRDRVQGHLRGFFTSSAIGFEEHG
jgi:hypothetical protein